MEGKKTQIKELDRYESEVLELIVHAEPFDSILSEFSGSAYILGDCLRSLLRKNLIHLYEWEPHQNTWKRTRLYDADRLSEYRYQLSALGMGYRESLT